MAQIELLFHNLADFGLLLFDGKRGVNDAEPEFLDHGLVFVHDASLKEPEAFLHIPAQVQIHARLVILERVAPAENAPQGDIQGDAKIESESGPYGKPVKVAHPPAAHAASGIAGESREGITIGADDAAGS